MTIASDKQCRILAFIRSASRGGYSPTVAGLAEAIQ